MAFLEEYTLLDELGQGGYATVYKVRHNKLGYIRAIRVLNATIAHGESDKTYQNFLEECKLLLRLGNGNHPNIVHIYQPLLRAQKAIVEMDFVDGKDLFHYLQDKSSFIEIEDVMKLLTDIGSALAYCHEDIYKFCMDKDEDNLKDDPNDGSKVLLDAETRRRLINKYRVIHNDIHSGNIIRREDGNFVLLDFGLAVNGDEVVRSSRRKNGAPEFKSPEKWDNEGLLTTRSDIYSFGVVLYEFLAGRVPFMFDKKNSNPTEAEYLLSKAHKEAIPESIFELRKSAFERSHPSETYKKDYPDWLEELIMKCLAKDPNERFRNGKELFSYVQKHSFTGGPLNVLKLEEENERLRDIVEKANASKVKIDELVLDLQGQVRESNSTRETLDKRIKKLQNENDELRAKLGKLSASHELSQVQVQQIKELEEQLESSKKKLAALLQENDSLKKEIETIKGEGKTKWNSIPWIIIFILCAIAAYLYFNGSLGDKKGNDTMVVTSTVELSEQEKIRCTIDNYYRNLIEKRYSELTSMFTDYVKRYYNTYDVTPSQIIKDLKSYKQTIGIVTEDIYVDWNTLNISKSGDITSINYDAAYITDKKDKTKTTVYQLKMYVDLDQQYKICSIYEVQKRVLNNFITESSQSDNEANQELISNLRTQIQEKENQISNLTTEMQSLKAEISRLKSSNQNSVNQSAITERDNKISQLQKQIKNLESTISEKNKEIKALQDQLF